MTALFEPKTVAGGWNNSGNSPTTTQGLIDAWWEAHKEKPRPHLGASLLGHPCERWLWLSFRWAVQERFSGRMLRLFDRGKREEESIVLNLRRIGIKIHSTCLDEDGQSRVDFGSYVSGSIDGIIEGGVPEAPAARHVAEFKTHNLKSFNELKRLGVFQAKRRHWCQMQVYMMGTGIERALYVAVCKDNDEMYTERIHYNPQAAHDIVERGKRIALSERMPPPLSTDPTWYQCRMCPAHNFCHVTHIIEEECVNCRTCAHSTPCSNSTWKCEFFGMEKSYEGQLWNNCASHVLHPDLTPWKFMGGGEGGRGAVYEIDGIKVLNGSGPGSISTRDLLRGVRVPEPDQSEAPF